MAGPEYAVQPVWSRKRRCRSRGSSASRLCRARRNWTRPCTALAGLSALKPERTSQVDEFAARLAGSVKHIVVLKGGMGAKQRRAIAEKLTAIPEGEERVLLATGRYIGEGFDDARLDTLFLAMPISWRGTLQQYVGRLHRLHDSKREVVVYDYVDGCVPVLSAMYSKRVRGYEAIGYQIQDSD